jgi:hypothetical protein
MNEMFDLDGNRYRRASGKSVIVECNPVINKDNASIWIGALKAMASVFFGLPLDQGWYTGTDGSNKGMVLIMYGKWEN